MFKRPYKDLIFEIKSINYKVFKTKEIKNDASNKIEYNKFKVYYKVYL